MPYIFFFFFLPLLDCNLPVYVFSVFYFLEAKRNLYMPNKCFLDKFFKSMNLKELEMGSLFNYSTKEDVHRHLEGLRKIWKLNNHRFLNWKCFYAARSCYGIQAGLDLCSPSWSQIHSNSPALASQVRGLQVYITTHC